MKKQKSQTKNGNKKLFVVRKYIWAESVQQAVHLDRTHPVEDCWVDDEWKKQSRTPADAIGFYVPDEE